MAVVAALSLAALAGCTAAATPTPSVDADSAAPVALQFGPNLAQPGGPPPEAIASGTAEPCPGNPAPARGCWTGHDLIVGTASLSAANPDVGRLAVAAYSPATGRWQTLNPPLPPAHQPGELNLVYDDGRLLLWSLWVWTRPRPAPGAPTSSR